MILDEIGNYSLYDRIIDISLYKPPKVTDGIQDNTEEYECILSIKCPENGPKPDISISFQALPGRAVSVVNVQITNLLVDNALLHQCTMMQITAGYNGTGNRTTIQINANVFSAYCESPNPDGVTRIQGIATGNAYGRFFGNRQYYVTFKGELTVRQVVEGLLHNEAVIMLPNFHEDVEVSFLNKQIAGQSESVGDMPFNVDLTDMKLHAENGYEVVRWLSRELYRWGRAHQVFIYVGCFNDSVKIALPIPGAEDTGKEPYVVLKTVSQVSFTTKVLTVVAPWTPSLIPGSLFSLNPVFFAMPNTYNTLGVDDFVKDPTNLYRVITLDVQFDTNGSQNQMKLLAVPYVDNSNPWDTSLMDESSTASLTKSDTKQGNMYADAAHKLVSYAVIGDDTNTQREMTEPQGSIWTKFTDINMPSKLVQTSTSDTTTAHSGTKDSMQYTFNQSNWQDLFTYIVKDTCSKEAVLSRASVDSVVVLKKSMKRKMKKRAKSDFKKDAGEPPDTLDPTILWPLIIVYAYLKSKENNTWLYKTLGKANNFGTVVRNVSDIAISELPNAYKDKPVSEWPQKYKEQANIYLPQMWLDCIGKTSIDWVKFYGPFSDNIKVIVENDYLLSGVMWEWWYCYLKESE